MKTIVGRSRLSRAHVHARAREFFFSNGLLNFEICGIALDRIVSCQIASVLKCHGLQRIKSHAVQNSRFVVCSTCIMI